MLRKDLFEGHWIKQLLLLAWFFARDCACSRKTERESTLPKRFLHVLGMALHYSFEKCKQPSFGLIKLSRRFRGDIFLSTSFI